MTQKRNPERSTERKSTTFFIFYLTIRKIEIFAAYTSSSEGGVLHREPLSLTTLNL